MIQIIETSKKHKGTYILMILCFYNSYKFLLKNDAKNKFICYNKIIGENYEFC